VVAAGDDDPRTERLCDWLGTDGAWSISEDRTTRGHSTIRRSSRATVGRTTPRALMTGATRSFSTRRAIANGPSYQFVTKQQPNTDHFVGFAHRV
jgi:hypothetical protein